MCSAVGVVKPDGQETPSPRARQLHVVEDNGHAHPEALRGSLHQPDGLLVARHVLAAEAPASMAFLAVEEAEQVSRQAARNGVLPPAFNEKVDLPGIIAVRTRHALLYKDSPPEPGRALQGDQVDIVASREERLEARTPDVL